MRRRILTATFLLFAGMRLSILAADPAPADGWQLVKESGGVVLYSHAREGSRLKEFKAVGEIEATTRAVYAVIEDIDAYPSFMPFTKETRLIRRERDSIVAYQRLSAKICADRDYTLRIPQEIVADEEWTRVFRSLGTGERTRPGRKARRISS